MRTKPRVIIFEALLSSINIVLTSYSHSGTLALIKTSRDPIQWEVKEINAFDSNVYCVHIICARELA